MRLVARAAGFTMVELLVSVAIVSIVAGLAVPALGEMMAARRVNSAAQTLAATFKTAQNEAIRRNRMVEVAFTSAQPTPANTVGAATVVASVARHWIARVANPTSAADFVGGTSLAGDFSAVTLTNADLRSVGFTPMGRALDLSTANPTALAAPLVVRLTAAGTSRAICVSVGTGGAVRVCDPSRPSGSGAACVPYLPAGAC
jgi:type IV fimbrial biogenesis protein FimT